MPVNQFAVAYGSLDINKTRITPKTIGSLISTMSKEQLKELVKGYEENNYYLTSEMLNDHKEVFKQLI